MLVHFASVVREDSPSCVLLSPRALRELRPGSASTGETTRRTSPTSATSLGETAHHSSSSSSTLPVLSEHFTVMEDLHNYSSGEEAEVQAIRGEGSFHLLNQNIPQCEGLSRCKWTSRCVTLHDTFGSAVAKGIIVSVSSDLVVGSSGPLGDNQVAVQISTTLCEEAVPDEWRFSVRAWSINLVFYNGTSLHDHEQRHKYNLMRHSSGQHSRRSIRPYSSVLRVPKPPQTRKSQKLLSAQEINYVASQVCCKKNCVQPFPRAKITTLRQRMYCSTDFNFRQHMKLDVHRQIHDDGEGNSVVTLEGIDVCLAAWRLIMGVSKTTFYRYSEQSKGGMQAGNHGNLGSKKPRQLTLQATATLKCILDKTADHMPHKSTTLVSGEKVVSMSLPSSWKWKDSLAIVNDVNKNYGLNGISLSNLSKIRKISFEQYDAKKPGDNFARCSTCDRYKSLEKSAIPGSQAELLWAKKLSEHLNAQRAHREHYYANRHRSDTYPEECVTIIHDKMDHGKTASPCFSHKTKSLDGLMKLPLQVTGMIAHGHGDVRYAHYGLDIYPKDANHTVGSFAKLLRDLEKPPMSSSRDLFEGSKTTPLYSALLEGAEVCMSSLPPLLETRVEAAPLPPILLVQLDNAASDNKNRFVFCFWSLLMAKGIFREVYVSFMLVGHTHDDIDALFGRWSMQLKQNNYPTIPLLMKSFMDAESVPVIPHLIEEVPDFKGFIANYIASGEEALEGHTKAQQFKFYVDSSGIPRMQYKIFCTDSEWLPCDGGGIKLWKEDSLGRPTLPVGSPQALLPDRMKNLDEIVKGIAGFISYWESMGREDRTGEYRRRYDHLIYYWRAVNAALAYPLGGSGCLQNGFWPMSRFASSFEDKFTTDGDIREEYAGDDHFVGQARDRPQPSFRVCRDLYAGYFVAIRPEDGDLRPMWIARATSDPNSDRERPHSVKIQYFRPTSRGRDVQARYAGWNSKTGLRWRAEENQPEEWVHTDSIITAWKSRNQTGSKECTMRIPEVQLKIIQSSVACFVAE